jgi:hypothetical protein
LIGPSRTYCETPELARRRAGAGTDEGTVIGVFEAMLLVLVTSVAIFGCAVGLGSLGVWLAVRKVRRSRAFNRGRLVMRTATAAHKLGREVGRLRVEMFDSVMATGRVLTEVDAPRVLRDLAHDLQRTADRTDHRLALLVAEPDQDLVARLLPSLRSSVSQLNRASAEVRATAWQFATELSQPREQALTLEVAEQLAGLRVGVAEVQAIRIRAGL